jgi:hypothetical protein
MATPAALEMRHTCTRAPVARTSSNNAPSATVSANAVFVRRRDFYAACVVALYLAASMDNVATYIADARAGDLPLLGGDRTNHDWTFLLIELGRLDRDITIGRFVHNVANTIFWIALPAGLWFAWHRGRHDDERDAAPNTPRRDIIVTTSNWKET